jgi:signal transduction histidine kinase
MPNYAAFAKALCAAALLAGAIGAWGASVPGTPPPERLTVFLEADFARSADRNMPADESVWTPVPLPDQWRRTRPDSQGWGWYRIRFELADAPQGVQGIKVRHRRGNAVDYFVNGSLVGGARDVTAMTGGDFGSPIFLTVPPGLLRAGPNVIHVRMNASSRPEAMHGLGTVRFGDARAVRHDYIRDIEIGFEAHRTFFAMAFVAGLIALFLWFARRSDRVMLWFSIACLSWSTISLLRVALRWMDYPQLNSVLVVYTTYGLVVPAVILCLRTVDLRWPRFEAALWAYLAVQVTYPLWWDGPGGTMRLTWDSLSTILLLSGVIIILTSANKPMRWPVKMEIVALLVMAASMFFEDMRYLGWIDVESPVLRHYHVPVMLVALGTAIFERHVLAIWSTERANRELERRVAEKAREIEANHARMRVAEREQMLSVERQRILADMHDGLGASLISLLRHVQSGRVDRGSIEQRVQEALQEMRIAVDALQPREGNLAAVLGSLRYRLDELIRSAGVRLQWEVDELPDVNELKPTMVFSLQRILLEAITNALKHSGARLLKVQARAQDDGTIEIRVVDDGRGFDPSQSAEGLGLANMRARAAKLGARLEVHARPGAGTTVRLSIPQVLMGAAAGEADHVTPAPPMPAFASA